MSCTCREGRMNTCPTLAHRIRWKLAVWRQWRQLDRDYHGLFTRGRLGMLLLCFEEAFEFFQKV